MNYKLHYDLLVEKARNRSILKTEYKEIHHILPRCMAGEDDPENLIALFPEEHLVAHLLLTKIYPENEGLLYAAFRMSKYGKLTNKNYGWLRKKYARQVSERVVSDKTRQKISKAHKGRKWNNEINSKKGLKGSMNPMFEKTHTVEVKEILRQKNIEQFSNYTNEEKKEIFNKISKANSKLWIVVSPEGEKMEILNLKDFCKNNGLLYEGMLAVKNGKQKTHRGGWICFSN